MGCIGDIIRDSLLDSVMLEPLGTAGSGRETIIVLCSSLNFDWMDWIKSMKSVIALS